MRARGALSLDLIGARGRFDTLPRLEVRLEGGGPAIDALAGLLPCCSCAPKRSSALCVVSIPAGSMRIRRLGRGVSCSRTSSSSNASCTTSSSLIASSVSSRGSRDCLSERLLTEKSWLSRSDESVASGSGRYRERPVVVRRLDVSRARVPEAAADVETKAGAAMEARVCLEVEADADILSATKGSARLPAPHTDGCVMRR